MNSQVGESLRHLRIIRGLSLSDAAREIGTNKSYLSAVERNHRKPGLKLLQRLSQLYFEPGEERTGRQQLIAQLGSKQKSPKGREDGPRNPASELIEKLELPVTCLLDSVSDSGTQSTDPLELSTPGVFLADATHGHLIAFLRRGDSHLKISISIEKVDKSSCYYTASWKMPQPPSPPSQ